MVEIAKCKCGADGRLLVGATYSSVDCRGPSCWSGPIRTTGAEAIAAWNAFMSPAPEPAAGTVRVRIPVHWMRHSDTFLIECQGRSGDFANFVSASVGGPVAYITAEIPLPQPVEIPGTVESGE